MPKNGPRVPRLALDASGESRRTEQARLRAVLAAIITTSAASNTRPGTRGGRTRATVAGRPTEKRGPRAPTRALRLRQGASAQFRHRNAAKKSKQALTSTCAGAAYTTLIVAAISTQTSMVAPPRHTWLTRSYSCDSHRGCWHQTCPPIDPR
ncbi:hypothetical protein HPB50_029228 [Hyalomma asiaticum]|nr:hypothetical protein HPB50_029228 [Hyalomma asiaticum]